MKRGDRAATQRTPSRKKSQRPGQVLACCWRTCAGVGFGAPSARPLNYSSERFIDDSDFELFFDVLDSLRDCCPPGKPVVIRRSPLLPQKFGTCANRPKRFVITLDGHLEEEQAIQALLHEWAHALAWNVSLEALARRRNITDQEFEQACHDEAWGCAYSRVWRKYSSVIMGRR